MAKLYNGIRVTTATTGTGTITLGSAVSGWLTFAQGGVGTGETVTYAIHDGTSFEIGRGVYTSSGPTLTRSVLKSTNSNSAINLSGAAQVLVTAAAEDFNALPNTLGAYNVALAAGTNVTANRTLTLTTGDADRTLDISAGSVTISTAGAALIDDASASAQRTTLGVAIGTDVQAYDAELAAIAGLTSAADQLPYFTGSGTASLATFTAAGRAILDDADASAQRTTLGLGTAATAATGTSGATVPLLNAATNTASGRFTPERFGPGYSLTIADDAVGTFDFNPQDAGQAIGVVFIWSSSNTAADVPTGCWRIRAGAYPAVTELFKASGASVISTTGALTGTTGTDGKFTISAHTDGLVYLENRSGSSKVIRVLVFEGT